MGKLDEKITYQLEYLHQVLASSDRGIQVWLDHFDDALNSSRFDDCEQMLLVARRSYRFSSSPVTRSVVIHNKGLLRLFQGYLEEAEQHFIEALTQYREAGDYHNEAQILTNLGEVHRLRNQWQAAIQFYKASEQIHLEKLDNPRGLAQVKNNLGLALMSLGHWLEAEQVFEQALTLFRKLDDKVEIVRSLNNLGRLCREQGKLERALEYFQEALNRCRNLNDEYSQVSVLNNLGALYRRQNQWAQSKKCYQSALELAWKTGDHASVAHIFNNLGELERLAGHFDAALEFYERSLEMGRALDDQSIVAVTMGNIGLVAAGKSQWTDAIEWYQQSLRRRRILEDREGQAVTLNNLGVAQEHIGFLAEALSSYKTAVALFKEVGNNIDAAAVLINMSQPPIGQEIPLAERQAYLEEALMLLDETEAEERKTLAARLLADLNLEQKSD